MDTLPARLKRIRKKLRLSPERLGAALGVSHQTIYRWERGKSHPWPLIRETIEKTLTEMEIAHER